MKPSSWCWNDRYYAPRYVDTVMRSSPFPRRIISHFKSSSSSFPRMGFTVLHPLIRGRINSIPIDPKGLLT